ncbi:hypothetical protein SDC9_204913 [bioreactor metagenome]|uniref:Type II secretion system protein GspG C-terminal domain-containing protein n=1 Tax=bioreactor metagenome TaxID=1076179 RepID=A0A645J3E0_9ZZZZ
MHLYEKPRGANRGLWITGIVFLLLALLFVLSLTSTAQSSAARESEVLDSALRRAIVTCYAVEGRYPPSLDYIAENYGVLVDETRYSVYYDAFAANVMPTLRVTRIGGGS